MNKKTLLTISTIINLIFLTFISLALFTKLFHPIMFKLSTKGTCYFLLAKARKDNPHHPSTKTLEDFCNMKEESEEWKKMETKLQKFHPNKTELITTSEEENKQEEIYNKYIKYSKVTVDKKDQSLFQELSYLDNVVNKEELNKPPFLAHLTFNQPVDALNKEESFTSK